MKLLSFCSVVGLLLTNLSAHAGDPLVKDVLQRPALLVSQPAQAVLIDVARAGRRVVAVGEQGLILLSDDDGKNWRQASVPISVSLTALTFPSPDHGWAVGHAGSVLHTADGGEHWTLQLDGKAAAQQVMDAVLNASSANGQAMKVAQRFVADGADKPFLAVHFSNDRQGTVVGAFGLVLHTEDGGQTWQSWVDRLDNPAGNHFYAVTGHGEQIYIAGEQGLLFASDDSGAHFKRVPTPYEGSFFAMNLAADGDLLLAGLRGNAWRTRDKGQHWQSLSNPLKSSLMAARTTEDGDVMFADQSGHLLLSSSGDGQLRVQASSTRPPVSALTQTISGQWIVVGARGVKRVDVRGEAK
ncbi:WD40/YVTN/BNR-like repeat-containing protein [Pseudomonas sp. SDO5271_S396]